MKKVDIIAEIGINHNGYLDVALEMITEAWTAGCDYVKFQKRDPEICVPVSQREIQRSTPWGMMSYIDYKHKIEFGTHEFDVIDQHCKNLGIKWFCSVWDEPSLIFMMKYNPEIIKIPSALNENKDLIRSACKFVDRVIISTGMLDSNSFNYEAFCDLTELSILHSVSDYPLNDCDANLSTIKFLRDNLPENIAVGYSDHTKGIHMPVAAVGMGAEIIEKHITLDRAMWGTDQAASIEPHALNKMVRNIRAVCLGWGDGSVKVRDCEAEAVRRLKGE